MDPPTLEGDTLLLRFPDVGVHVRLDRWRERGGQLGAEVAAWNVMDGTLVHQASLGLASTRARIDFARACYRRAGALHGISDGLHAGGWEVLIEQVCVEALRVRRQGEPAVDLATVPTDAVQYRWDGWVPEDGVTVAHADGGTGKSTLGLALACAVAAGIPLLGVPTRQGRPLYVDYETGERTQARRLRLLARGLEIDVPEVLHKRLDVPLPQCAPELRRLCDAESIAFVVLDSLGYAGAVHRDTEETLAVFRALHSLRRPVFAIHHDNRAGEIFGSIYIHNSARSRIEIRKQQDAGDRTLRLALLHRKANDDTLRPPLGVELRFLADATLLKRADIEDVPELAEHLSIAARIKLELRAGPRRPDELAEALGTTPATIRAKLNGPLGGQVLKLPSGAWALLDDHRREP